MIVLTGVAGGIARGKLVEDRIEWVGAQPGDIVVAEYVHYADFTKNVPGKRLLRYFPCDHPTSSLVEDHADALRKPGLGHGYWADPIQERRPLAGESAVHIGEIIAVEGVAGDPRNPQQRDFLTWFDHAIAVDMESAGVGRAVHEHRNGTTYAYNPRWMCVRAITDRVYAVTNDDEERAVPDDADNAAERDLWKEYSAAAAGQFTRRLVERLLAEPRDPSGGDPGAPAFQNWP